MRCLLLLLLMAILSLLAALFVRRKSGREVATENNFRIQLMDSAITKKPSKRERKKEPWIRVLKRAAVVKQMCKEWSSKRSFPVKQVKLLKSLDTSQYWVLQKKGRLDYRPRWSEAPCLWQRGLEVIMSSHVSVSPSKEFYLFLLIISFFEDLTWVKSMSRD